jgi:hypothetical protein
MSAIHSSFDALFKAALENNFAHREPALTLSQLWCAESVACAMIKTGWPGSHGPARAIYASLGRMISPLIEDTNYG